jgi:hypothetical protein
MMIALDLIRDDDAMTMRNFIVPLRNNDHQRRAA